MRMCLRQTTHLPRCQPVITRSTSLSLPRAAATQSTMVQSIDGPKDVTELLTDLSNKYEAVRCLGPALGVS